MSVITWTLMLRSVRSIVCLRRGLCNRTTGSRAQNGETDFWARTGTGDWAVAPDFGPVLRLTDMLKQLQMGMRAFLLMASRVWTCVCFLLKKQVRAVSRCFAPVAAFPSLHARQPNNYLSRRMEIRVSLFFLSLYFLFFIFFYIRHQTLHGIFVYLASSDFAPRVLSMFTALLPVFFFF